MTACRALAALWAALMCAPSDGRAEDAYTTTMLRGMKSAVIFYTENDTEKCRFEKGIEKRSAFAIGTLKSLGLEFVEISPEAPLPDASVLVMLEASDSRIEPDVPVCNIFVKFEVFHQMLGELRYSGANPVLRVLAYRTFHVGSAPANRLSDAMHRAATEAFEGFTKAYASAQGK